MSRGTWNRKTWKREAVRRLTRTFEEAYNRERDMRGHLSAGFVRDLRRSFKGQIIEDRRRPVLHG